MATREYAKNLFTKWIDDDWLNQPVFDKLFWEGLNGTRAVNLIGVAPMNFTRWRRMMRDGHALATDTQLKMALIRMGRRRYVYIDETTGEYLIRSRMRRDDLDKQPNSFLSALRALAILDSPRFAVVLRGELDRMTLPIISTARNEKAANKLQDDLKRAWDAALTHLTHLAEGITEPIPDPFAEDFPEGIPDPIYEGITEGITRPAETQNPRDPISDPIPEGIHLVSGSVSGSLTSPGTHLEEEARANNEPTPTEPPNPHTDPPPRYCPHIDDDNHPRKCGDCKAQRIIFDRWLSKQDLDIKRHLQETGREELAAREAKRAAAEQARQTAITNCPLGCDPDGYLGGTVCDHNPNRQAINARGIAAVRAALTGHPPDTETTTDPDEPPY